MTEAKHDPINPAHYNGTACAEIGERLSGNSYQVLKYNWRLGKKDDPIIEMGKSIWYLDREILIAEAGFRVLLDIPPDSWFERLLPPEPFVREVIRDLLEWNRHNKIGALRALRKKLIVRRAILEEELTGQGSMEV